MALEVSRTGEVAVIGLGSAMKEVRVGVDAWRRRRLWVGRDVESGRVKRFHIWGRLSLVFGRLDRGSGGLHLAQRFTSSTNVLGDAISVKLGESVSLSR